MLRIAGQTAEPIGLKFVVDTNGWALALKAKKMENFVIKLKKKISTGHGGPVS